MVLFELERIIDEVEGSLTGAPINATNPAVTEVTVEENSDEDITAGAKFSKINKSSDEMEIYMKEK